MRKFQIISISLSILLFAEMSSGQIGSKILKKPSNPSRPGFQSRPAFASRPIYPSHPSHPAHQFNQVGPDVEPAAR